MALADLTTQRVIFGVLLLIILLPLFDLETGLYGTNTGMDVGGIKLLHDVALVNDTGAGFLSALQSYQASVTYDLGVRQTSQIWFLQIKNQT